MTLSRLAQQFADEIRQHDWSDAHSRIDRAGHRHEDDRTGSAQLTPEEAERVRLNVVWVTAQVLLYNDANFDVHEFAESAGVADWLRLTSRRKPSGTIDHGLRVDRDRRAQKPGTREFDAD